MGCVLCARERERQREKEGGRDQAFYIVTVNNSFFLSIVCWFLKRSDYELNKWTMLMLISLCPFNNLPLNIKLIGLLIWNSDMHNLASALGWQIKFQLSAFDIPSEISKSLTWRELRYKEHGRFWETLFILPQLWRNHLEMNVYRTWW